MKRSILIFFVLFSLNIKGQKVVRTFISGSVTEYYGLESIKGEIKDSVKTLYLGNCGLKEFPNEILSLKNISDLSFIDRNIGEIYREDTLRLSIDDRKLARRIFAKVGRIDRVEAVRGFPTRNKNKIKSIPKEIFTLTNLSSLQFGKHQLSRREIKKLKKLLPKCDIYID